MIRCRLKFPSLCLYVFGFLTAWTASAQQLKLLDARTGGVLQVIGNASVIDLNQFGKRTLNVQYESSGSIGSVEFEVNGSRSVDSVAPYLMGGSAEGVDGAWLPVPGTYQINATEFSGTNGTGVVVSTLQVELIVEDALAHRMRKVKLSTGIPGQLVRVRMLKHGFPFGSMVKASNDPDVKIYESDTFDEQMYQSTFLENFNASVSGNAMKWYTQQPDWWSGSPHNQGYAEPGQHRFDTADNILAFLNANEIPMRGHTIFWGEIGNGETPENQMQDPNWVEALGTDSLYWIEQRAKTIVGRYAGQIDEWDFNNELWHGDWYRRTFGPWITKQMADWALEANPNLKLWFNEYGMLNNSSNARQFKLMLEQYISDGVQIDGIGVQGHFGSAPNPATVQTSLDILDDLGLPIKITEFDCGWSNATQDQEADGLEVVYRTAFAHPSVEGIIMWGFWEGNHWRPERALWLTDWTPTQQALRYRSLVFDEWWTEAELVTNSLGELEFAAFAGDFELEIGEVTYSTSFTGGAGVIHLVQDGIELVVDSPLEVSLIKPVTGNKYAVQEAVEFAASVSSGDSPVSHIEFYVDGDLLKRDSVAPYTAVWLDTSLGDHDAWAVVTDESGAETISATVAFSVDAAEPNALDTDKDGMLDQWELDNFGSLSKPGTGPFEDWDEDKVINRTEFRSGTDPTDPMSKFVATDLEFSNGELILDWQSVPGKSYRVIESSDLGLTPWITIQEAIEAVGPDTSTTLPINGSVQFLRVDLDE